MDYTEFKKAQSDELDAFIKDNVFWAFSNQQLDEKLAELNITKEQMKEQYVAFFGGGAIKRDKVDEYKQLAEKHYQEKHSKMLTDFEFAKSAFKYEFGNYECFISYRFDEALATLGVSQKDLEDNNNLLKAYGEAKKEYWDWCVEHCC